MTTSSWVPGAAGSGYDVDHLPYAVFTTAEDDEPRVGVRIGGLVLDVAPVAAAEMLDVAALFEQPTLNPLMAAGPQVWASVRTWLTQLLTDEAERELVEPHLVALDEVTTRLGFEVADYVDFLCGKQHAENAGRIFRPDSEPLGANFTSLPIGYHGRAGTVVVTGTPIARPSGQRPSREGPTFGPTRRLDLEAELGFVVGTPSATPVGTGALADHVFGVTLLNDWSARDIQAWESQPLGPFLGKSFGVSVSDWITPLAALEPAKVALPAQDPPPLDYLVVEDPRPGYDVEVEVILNGEVVSRPPYRVMYWSPAQMLAHLTSNGATLRTGDLFGSGTISGDEREQRGCLLELSWGGREPFTAGGVERSWLEDGDEVTLRATAPGASGGRIALGEVTGRIEPATSQR
ncbi:fumarylacetoacetase [Nocardioides mangrovicus]|uniref:fumarylacetoacetase n=1 Tax=Nocardioides mangrovicus TaxID=2478913 RepID=A0A3L8P4S7_9ACTN|nr:fumarylacetoacetate hydrolase family protein [Nocardioides mangrovicus]RLV50124.1 fumarylacetoacetase [Nocardioides mangrovicus]